PSCLDPPAGCKPHEVPRTPLTTVPSLSPTARRDLPPPLAPLRAQDPARDADTPGGEPPDRQAGLYSGHGRARPRPDVAQQQFAESPGPARGAGECPAPPPPRRAPAVHRAGLLPH